MYKSLNDMVNDIMLVCTMTKSITNLATLLKVALYYMPSRSAFLAKRTLQQFNVEEKKKIIVMNESTMTR